MSLSRQFKLSLALCAIAASGLVLWMYAEVGLRLATRLVASGLIVTAIVAILFVPFALWFMGFIHRKARIDMLQAAEFARFGKYAAARQMVQSAIRFNPAIASAPDAIALYRIILTGPMPHQSVEIRRVSDAIRQWPMTNWEIIATHWMIRIGVPLIFGACTLLHFLVLLLAF